MSTSPQSKSNLRIAQLSLLIALVVVLQLLSYTIKIGTFNLSLVLIPIVVGAALLGERAGALLGCAFGIVTLLASAFGLDLGGNVLWLANPLMTTLICLVKGTAAGLVAGLIIRAFANTKHPRLGIWLGALAAPVVNTGLFVGGMLLVFRDILTEWAAGDGTAHYIVFGLLGLNFLIEVAINALLSPTVIRIIGAVRKNRGLRV